MKNKVINAKVNGNESHSRKEQVVCSGQRQTGWRSLDKIEIATERRVELVSSRRQDARTTKGKQGRA